MRARVFVTLKPSVFDPQGRTIAEALHSLGYAGIEEVRQGKALQVDPAAPAAAQCRTSAEALHSLGYAGIEEVRQGKYFELDLATTEAAQAAALASDVAD